MRSRHNGMVAAIGSLAAAQSAAAHPLSQRLAFRVAFALGWTASTGQLALRMT
jgi:hypothetical protein